MNDDIVSAAQAFELPGPIVSLTVHAGGHINASYLLTCATGGEGEQPGLARFLLQRLNDRVFSDPVAVMRNVTRVLDHLHGVRRAPAQTVTDIGNDAATVPFGVAPRLVPTRNGSSHHRDAHGGIWRLFRFIDAIVYESVSTPQQAYEAGRAFGAFQRHLRDLPPDELIVTLPGFHHTPARYEAFEAAVARDVAGRARSVRDEIDRLRAHAHLKDALQRPFDEGRIPTRIAHNDAKITNVLFDPTGRRAMCVADLDTVMPGLSLHDFGDMMRSMLCPCREDEPDPSRIEAQAPLFEGLVRGYLEQTSGFLTPLERDLLVTSGQVITFEQALRFFSDYLSGDVYYRVEHPLQNLDRARVQCRLLESLVRRQAALQRIAAAV